MRKTQRISSPSLARERSIMHRLRATACMAACIAVALAGMQPALAQTSGTWTTNGNGTWSTTSNWSGATVASGAGALANFGSVDLTANATITLDTNRTIGRLIFGDTVWTNSGFDWTLQSGTLTLDNTGGTGGNPPSITVLNRTTTISSILAGSNGLSLALPWSNYDATRSTTFTNFGMVMSQTAGALVFTGSNTLSGTLSVNGGTVRAGGTAGRFGSATALSIAGNGSFINGDATAASNNGITNRLGDGTATLSLGGSSGGGTFTSAFAASGTTSQTFASLTVNAGMNALATANTAAGTNNLVFTGAGGAGYVRTANGLVNVTTAAGFQPQFTNAPTAAGGSSVTGAAGSGDEILTGAILGGSDFIKAASGTFSPATYVTTLTAGKNVNVTGGNLSTSSNLSINSLRLSDTTQRTVTITSSTLTIASGGILLPQSVTGTNINHTVTGGSLTSGVGDLWIYAASGSAAPNNGNADLRALNYSATIASKITGSISLTVGGNASSKVLLSGANDYDGGTFLQGGLVAVNADSGLGASTGSVTALSGANAVVSLAASNYSSSRNIVVNSGAMLTWHNKSGVDATLSGTVSGGGQLELGFVSGGGRYILTGSNSGFTGQYVLAGILRADEGVGLSSNANLLFIASPSSAGGSGVLETSGTFTRALGSGAGQVQWQTGGGDYNSGGFVAIGGPLTINFGGNATPDTVTAGSYFLPSNGSALILGSASSTGDITFQNGIALNGVQRPITVTAAGSTKATMSGVLSGNGSSGIIKQGSGLLVLTGFNTYGGATTISGGTLSVSSVNRVSGGSAWSGLGAPTTAASGTIAIGNSNNAATLLYTGSGETSDRGFSLAGSSGGATIDQSGSGALVFGGNVSVSAAGNGSKALTLQGSGAGTGELSGAISDGPTGSTVTTQSSYTTDASKGWLTLSSVYGLVVGGTVSASGIPANTTITSIDTAARRVYLSQNLTTSISNPVTITAPGVINQTSVVKAGSGMWTLSGANIYTGSTAVQAGTLKLAKVASLYNGGTASWTAANISVSSGATLALNVGGTSTGEFGTADVTTLMTNLGGLGGTVNNNGLRAGASVGFDTTNAADGSFTLADNLANSTGTGGGAIGLTKFGAGTLILSGSNTFTGTTSINAGTLALSGGGTLGATTAGLTLGGGQLDLGGLSVAVGNVLGTAAFASGDTIRNGTLTGTGFSFSNTTGTATISANLAGVGAALTKSGAGTLTLSAANTFTGGLTISAGTLLLGPGAGLSGSNAITINGGMFDLGGNNQTTTGIVSFANTTTLQGGTLTSNNASVASPNNEVAGTLTLGTGGAFITNRRLRLGDSTSGTLTIAAGSTGSVTFGGDNNAAMNYVGNGTGTATLTINGGTVNFTNSNNGTGNGYLNIGSNSDAANGTVVVNGGNLNVGTLLKLGGNFSSALATNARSSLSITSGTVVVGGGDGANAGILYMNGAVGDTASTKTSGTAALTLGAGGVLAVSQIQTGSYGTDTITFDGGTLLARASSTSFLAASAPLTVNVNAGGATIDTGTFSITIAPVLRDGGGGGGLTKLGSGSLALSAANTYAGATSINAGTLEIASTGRLGSAGTYSGALSNNGAFIYSGTNNQTISGLTTGSGSFTNNAASTLTFSGSMALSGASNAISTTANGAIDITGNLSTAPGSVLTLAVGGGASTGQTRLWGSSNTVQGEVLVTGGSGTGGAVVWSYTSGVNSLSGATKITVASGNTLRYWSASIGAGTAFDLNGTGNTNRGVLSFYDSGTSTVSGPVNLSGNSSIYSRNAALTLAGTITESGGARALTLVADPGGATTQVYTLSGSNSFSGGLTFTALDAASASTKLLAGSSAAFGTGVLTLNSLTQATATAIVDLNGQAITIGGLSGGNLANANSFIQSDSGAAVLTVNQAASGTFSGAIRNGTGSVSLTKSGNGTLTLSGSNTYSGATTLSVGSLQVGNASALGSGTISFAGGTLQYGSGITTDLSGRVSTATGQQFNVDTNGQSVTWATALAGANNTLTKLGSGTLALSGASTYSGATNINAGTLQIGSGTNTGALNTASTISGSAGGTLAFNRSDAFNQSSVVNSVIGGNINVTQLGAGTVTLNGVNTYTGTTSVVGVGRLIASSANSLGTGSEVRVATNGGNDYGLEVAAGVTITGKNLELSGASGRSNLFLNSNSTWAGNITFTNGNSFNQIWLKGTNAFITGTISVPGTYSGGALGVGLRADSNSNTATVSGPILAGSNMVNAYGGTWTFTNTNNTMGSLSMQGTTLRIREAGQLASGSYAGRIIFAASTTGLFDYGSSADQILSGLISGSGSVTQGGAGTLTISSATNTYVGVTTVNAGILSVANLSNGGVNSAIGASSSAAANLVLGGGRLRYTGDSVTTDRSFTLTASTTSTIDVSTAGTTLTFTGSTASTSGALTKAGAGTLVLAGAAAYSGGTWINAGTLTAGHVSAFGTGVITLASGATLDLANLLVTNSITNNGGTIRGGTITGTVSGMSNVSGGQTTFDSTIAGGARIDVASTGTASFGNGAVIESGATFANDGLLRVNRSVGSGALAFGGAVSGSGRFQLDGGIARFDSANTYSGNTVITGSGSRLALGAAGSFANSPVIVVGDATSTNAILDLTAKSGTFAIGNGQTLKGGGTIQLAANGVLDVQGTFTPGNSPGLFTYDGGTTLLSGTTIMEIFGENRATLASHGTDPYYDAVNVINGGTLTFGGLLTLDITGTYADNTTFNLFMTSGSGSSLTGNFSNIVFAPSSLYSSLTFTSGTANPKLWTSTATDGGQSFTFDAAVGTLVIVPEPGAIALAGIGIAMAGWSLWKRRLTHHRITP